MKEKERLWVWALFVFLDVVCCLACCLCIVLCFSGCGVCGVVWCGVMCVYTFSVVCVCVMCGVCLCVLCVCVWDWLLVLFAPTRGVCLSVCVYKCTRVQ